MAMQASEKVYSDLLALGAASGVTKGVFQHIAAHDIDALANTPMEQRPSAIRKALTQAVVSSLSENGQFLRAATTSRVVQNAKEDATGPGRGLVADPVFGHVANLRTDTGAMMESIKQHEPKFFAAFASRIEDSAINLAALAKLSPANYEMRGKEIFDGNITASQIRSWVAGNAQPAGSIGAPLPYRPATQKI